MRIMRPQRQSGDVLANSHGGSSSAPKQPRKQPREEAASAPPSKRRPGRPRKQPREEAASAPPSKRRPCRPRKKPRQEVASASSNVDIYTQTMTSNLDVGTQTNCSVDENHQSEKRITLFSWLRQNYLSQYIKDFEELGFYESLPLTHFQYLDHCDIASTLKKMSVIELRTFKRELENAFLKLPEDDSA